MEWFSSLFLGKASGEAQVERAQKQIMLMIYDPVNGAFIISEYFKYTLWNNMDTVLVPLNTAFGMRFHKYLWHD